MIYERKNNKLFKVEYNLV